MKIRIFRALALAVSVPAALAGLHSPALGQAAPARHATEDFAQLPSIEGPQISPDGRQLAAKLAIQGQQYFAIVPLEGGSQPRIVRMDGNDLDWFSWVNNEWLIAGASGKMSIARYGEVTVTRAVGINAANGELTLLRPPRSEGLGLYAGDLVWTANDGTPRVAVAMQSALLPYEEGFWPSVYEFDLTTGRPRKQVTGRQGVFDWSADQSGIVRMGIGREEAGRRYRVLYRPDERSGFDEVIQARTRDRDVVLPSAFLGNRAIALAVGSDGYTGVYEYDLDGLQLGRRLFGHEGYDVDSVQLTPDGTSIAAYHYTSNSTHVVWVDERLQALDAEVRAKVQGGSISISTYSDDLQRAVVRVGATDSPGAHFLYDRASGAMIRIAETNPAIGLRRLHPVSSVRYQARDGVEIEAVLTLPRGQSTGLPLILLPHGGPAARDFERWDWWTQFLADRGYAVIQPNYRGSTGYGEDFQDLGIGEWGLKMQDDLNDAITYLAEQGTIDPARVCIVGASYGGYAALRGAQRDPSLFRCAISYAGVSDLQAMLNYNRRFLYSAGSSDWLREQAPDMRSISPLNFPEQFGVPTLIVHGREDRTVPVAQSRDMAEKLRAAGKPVTYIEQRDGDHHFSRSEDRLEFLRAMEAFLAEHNPA